MLCLSVFSWRRRHFPPLEIQKRGITNTDHELLKFKFKQWQLPRAVSSDKKETCVPDPLERIYRNKNKWTIRRCARSCVCMWNWLFPRLSFTCHSGLTRSLMTFPRYYGIESTTKTQSTQGTLLSSITHDVRRVSLGCRSLWRVLMWDQFMQFTDKVISCFVSCT